MDTIESRPHFLTEMTTTAHGRLLCASFAVALLGGGLGATMHDGIGAGIMAGSLIGAVATALFAIGMAVGPRSSFAIMSMILLPAPLLAYSLAINIIQHRFPLAGYGVMLMGMAFASVAAFGGPESRHVHHPDLAHAH